MKIVSVNNLVEGNEIQINLFHDDMIIFLEKESNYIGQLNRYSSIHKFNCRTQGIEKFKFSMAADLVSHINMSTFIYYAYIDKNKDNYWISLYKINCINWIEEEILSFDTGVSNVNEKDYIQLFLNSCIIGLNEQYVLIAIPSCHGENGQNNFSKMVLIDSFEKKSFIIPDKITESDTFLRLDNAWVTESGEYVILKTGRIQPFEKEMIFKSQEENEKIDSYCDSVETIVVCNMNEFIKNVKVGNAVDKKDIVQTIDFEGALSVVGKNNMELIYSINSFTKNISQAIVLNLESYKKNIIELKNYYEEILYFNKKLFGLIEKDNIISIYDIYKNKKIFDTDQRIVYLDDENIITFRENDDFTRRIVTIYKLIDGEIIDSAEYDVMSFYFNYEKNILVLF